MLNENQAIEYHNNNNVLGVLAGLVIGGLAGAGAMLLLAPQSGEKTRMQIREKGIELRDQATGKLEATWAKVWLAKKQITRDGRRKAKELVHHSQALAVEKFENVSDAAKAWKKANLGS
jgi:gas vesicle protein